MQVSLFTLFFVYVQAIGFNFAMFKSREINDFWRLFRCCFGWKKEKKIVKTWAQLFAIVKKFLKLTNYKSSLISHLLISYIF